ncbi:hypothetical protein LIER_37762 [Lithospermum erythrorhizon]|uniref:DUF4216 domain-containing protein n=1 Tax=Lithospermum erythrorhizon TaxID=34254 RepID=A0AAV3PQR4_LITER
MQVHPKSGMAQLKFKKKKGSEDDPFILASQAQQVFYLDFLLDVKKDLEWVVATKTFARIRNDWTNIQDDDDNNDDFFQEDEQLVSIPIQPTLELDNNNILVVLELYDVEDRGQVKFEKQNVINCKSDDDENDSNFVTDNEEDDY